MDYINESEKVHMALYSHRLVSRHEHNFLEFVYVISGNARHDMNQSQVVLKKGDFFIIDYSTTHSYVQIGTEPFQVMNCLFLPSFIDRTLRECRKFSEVIDNYLIHYSYKSVNANPANMIFTDENRYVYNQVMKMYDEYRAKSIGYVEVMRCILIEIIIHTMRKIQTGNPLVYNSIEGYIVQYVRENYMKKITLREIAEKLKYSLPYVSKTFSENYGLTFEKFLQKTRIEQSCRLLANSDKKIIDIAECVGYADLKFFTATFKKFMRVTPREYRKLHV